MEPTSNAAIDPEAAAAQQRHRAFWLRRARQVRRHVAAAWFLQRLGLPLVGFALLGAWALLLWRWQGERSPLSLALATGSLLLPLLLAAGLALPALRRAPPIAVALARLDRSLGLNNRLSTAAEGAGPWPAPLGLADDGYRIRWSKPAPALVGSLALLLLAAWLPLPGRPQQALPLPPPASHEQLADLLEAARRSGLFDEEKLAQMAIRAAEVSSGLPQQEWHQQAALEAAQAVLQQQRAELATQAERLSRGGDLLERLAQPLNQLSPAQREQLATRAADMIERAAKEDPGIDPRLLAQLRAAARQAQEGEGANGVHPAAAAQLNPAQRQALEQLLQENRIALEKLVAGMGLQLPPRPGPGQGKGPGRGGDQPGMDGPAEGGGAAPLDLAGDGAPRLGRGKGPRALDSSGRDDGPAGALIDTTDRTPVADDLNLGQRQAGSTAARAAGGDLTHHDQLLPAERYLLREFYTPAPAPSPSPSP